MTATPFYNSQGQGAGLGLGSGSGVELPGDPAIQIYSCQHCGKEFTSKRKHQRHVLNVHFG